jgi:hypothetical protein
VYAVAGTGASYIAGQRAAPTMHCELSLEERFQLRRLALELLPCSREQLIRQVLEEREDALLQGRFYRQALEAMGCELVEEADVELVLPQSEAELMKVFGRRPSDQELADYLQPEDSRASRSRQNGCRHRGHCPRIGGAGVIEQKLQIGRQLQQKLGLSSAQAAGVLGNFVRESNLNPRINEGRCGGSARQARWLWPGPVDRQPAERSDPLCGLARAGRGPGQPRSPSSSMSSTDQSARHTTAS